MQKPKRTGANWKKAGSINDFAPGKDVKAVQLGGDTLMLYKTSGSVFCSQSNSTAFKFPLTDAKVFQGELMDESSLKTLKSAVRLHSLEYHSFGTADIS